MRSLTKTSIATSLVLCALQASAAAECVANSGPDVTPLLELYTSEGCSSCPPADEWLSGLPRESSHLVPLAFHVDYWDYIGWKDRFAQLSFSDRQRKAAAFNSSSFVYTPQFVFNGRDFKGWSNARLKALMTGAQKKPSRADLSMRMTRQAGGEMVLWANAQLLRREDTRQADVYVALFENGLNSKVRAGENNGRELRHDFVVRELFGAYPITQGTISKSFTLSPEWNSRNAGAVVFVQNRVTGEVIQSLQLLFCH